MPIVTPPAVNYPSPLVSVPARYNNEPTEGERFVPAEIDWATMGGTQDVVAFNLSISAAQTISQIVALSIDNSQCSTDIQFVFPDTGQTYTIPAYSPAEVVPVFTNALSFFVQALSAISTDITRFAIHNALPPPSSVDVTTEQQTATVGTVSTATGNTQIIPAGTNGRVEAIYVQGQFTGGANGSAVVELMDGQGNLIAVSQCSSNNTINQNVPVFALSNLSVRFQNGLSFKVVGSTLAGGSSAFAVNVYYRTP